MVCFYIFLSCIHLSAPHEYFDPSAICQGDRAPNCFTDRASNCFTDRALGSKKI